MKPKTMEQPGQILQDWRDSPAAQLVIEKIEQGGPNYLKENFERVLIDSYSLADEPEFADLYFDEEKTVIASERFAREHHQQFLAAQMKGEDEAHQVLDIIRIDIIDELARPRFRQEIWQRLDRITNRLAETSDVSRLEMVLILQAVLRENIPWGICGLILAIYDRTLQRARSEAEEEEEFKREVMALFAPDPELDTSPASLPSPDREQLFREKLEARPDLRQRIERRMDKMVEDFELALLKGTVQLNLFTFDELLLPFKKPARQYVTGADDPMGADSPSPRRDIVQSIRDSLAEILTPERLQKIKSKLEQILQQWQREGNKWAMHLQLELDGLEETNMEQSFFFMAAYAGQIQRTAKSQDSGKLQHGRSTPSKSRGLVSRSRKTGLEDG